MSRDLLKEIANWKLEAKLEDNQRYFFHTSDVDLLEAGSRCYVIGRKGTGKTAISEYLYQDISYRKFSQKLTFKNFPFNDLYQLKNSSFTSPNQYITLWKYLIYSSIAKMMLKNESIDCEIRGKLDAIYSDDPVQSLSRTISKWTGKNAKFSILGTGGGGGVVQEEITNDIPWIERVEILENLIRKYIDNSSYLIVFDELDEDYKDITVSEKRGQYTSLLTSLFKAVQDIKSLFPADQFKILPIIFLRDDIYEFISDPDKTKWSDLTIELDWSSYKIKDLLAFRLSRAIAPNGRILRFADAWDSAFLPDPVHYGHRQLRTMSSFDFITRSSLLRPRDYIRYLHACADSSIHENHSLISPTTVVKVDKAFSNYMRSEMEDEIGGILSDVKQILDIIAHIRKQTFSISEFKEAYTHEVTRGSLPDRNPEQILGILFHFSVIGNQPAQKNIKVFRYTNKEARLNLKEVLCVHRGLYKALQIL